MSDALHQPLLAQGTTEAPTADISSLQDLLRKDPQEIANWAVGQFHQLSRPGVDVNALPIFRLAGAVSTATQEERAVLTTRAIQGFGELPSATQADLLRLVVQPPSSAAPGQPGPPVFSGPASSGQGPIFSGPDSPPSPDSEYSFGSPRQGNESLPPVIENLFRVIHETGLESLPAEDQKQLAEEAVKAVQPSMVAGVVHEFSDEERNKIKSALVESQIVPKEQEKLLEDTMRPGGYADSLSQFLQLCDLAKEYAVCCKVVPLVEIVISIVFADLACDEPLDNWLWINGVTASLVVFPFEIASKKLAPVYDVVRADALGSIGRLTQAPLNVWELESWLTSLVPGLSPENAVMGMGCAATAAFFLVVQVCVAVIGAEEVVGVLFMYNCDNILGLCSLCSLLSRYVVLSTMYVRAKNILMLIPWSNFNLKGTSDDENPESFSPDASKDGKEDKEAAEIEGREEDGWRIV